MIKKKKKRIGLNILNKKIRTDENEGTENPKSCKKIYIYHYNLYRVFLHNFSYVLHP